MTTETTAAGEKTEGTAESLKARLSGAEEFPGPGVTDGVGAVLVDITGTKVCYDLKVTMGEKPTKAHIHQGAKGASGPVVVDLNPAFEPGESAFNARSRASTSPPISPPSCSRTRPPTTSTSTARPTPTAPSGVSSQKF